MWSFTWDCCHERVGWNRVLSDSVVVRFGGQACTAGSCPGSGEPMCTTLPSGSASLASRMPHGRVLRSGVPLYQAMYSTIALRAMSRTGQVRLPGR